MKHQTPPHGWDKTEAELRAWSEDQEQKSPTEAEVAALLQRAHARRFRVSPMAVAAAAAALLAVSYGMYQTGEPVAPASMVAVPSVVVAEPVALALLYEEGGTQVQTIQGVHRVHARGGRVLADVGGHRVGLSADSRIAVMPQSEGELRLRLEHGLAAVDVGPDGQPMVVEVADAEVHIVEARVQIRHDGAATHVDVLDGAVAVHRGASQHETSKHTRLDLTHGIAAAALPDDAELAELLSEHTVQLLIEPERAEHPVRPAAPAPADLEALRARLAAGERNEVVRALQVHLATHPEDGKAKGLLGDALRASGDLSGAAEAWTAAGVLLRGASATTTRYKAATALGQLGQDKAASAMWRQVLQDAPGVLRSDALLRLSECERRLGHADEATSLLRQLVADHPASRAAGAARSRLAAQD
jgi:ferric-dicitrate binding protein FerR (iron transport regulator)